MRIAPDAQPDKFWEMLDKIVNEESQQKLLEEVNKKAKTRVPKSLLPKPKGKLQCSPDRTGIGSTTTGYLYQRRKGDRLIWEYSFNAKTHYVSKKIFSSVKDAIASNQNGNSILFQFFGV